MPKNYGPNLYQNLIFIILKFLLYVMMIYFSKERIYQGLSTPYLVVSSYQISLNLWLRILELQQCGFELWRCRFDVDKNLQKR